MPHNTEIGIFSDGRPDHEPYAAPFFERHEDGRMGPYEIKLWSARDNCGFSVYEGRQYTVRYENEPFEEQYGSIKEVRGIATEDDYGHFVLMNAEYLFADIKQHRNVPDKFIMNYIPGVQIVDSEGNQIFELPIAVTLPEPVEVKRSPRP